MLLHKTFLGFWGPAGERTQGQFTEMLTAISERAGDIPAEGYERLETLTAVLAGESITWAARSDVWRNCPDRTR